VAPVGKSLKCRMNPLMVTSPLALHHLHSILVALGVSVIYECRVIIANKETKVTLTAVDHCRLVTVAGVLINPTGSYLFLILRKNTVLSAP